MKALILLIALVPAVCLAGPLDKPSTGLQPSSGGLTAGPRAFKLTGVVFQKLPAGLIIDASGGKQGGGRPVGLIYVEGDFPKLFNEMPFSMNVADAGTYSYTAANGSAQMIRKMVPAR